MITVRLMEELKKKFLKFMLLLFVVLRWKFIRVMLRFTILIQFLGL